MSVSESDRLALYEKMKGQFGQKEANTLMEMLPPTQWRDIAATDDVTNLGIAIRSEMIDLRGQLRDEMAELRDELRGQMAELNRELTLGFTAIETRVTHLLIGFTLTILLGMGGMFTGFLALT